MTRKGRKAMAGKRTKSGRLKRDHSAPTLDERIVQPSAWVADMRARYGQDYCSALGRAYASGLLGDEAEAKIRLDVGKRFQRLYASILEQRPYRCALNAGPRGGSQHGSSERMQEQDWLFDAMNALDRAKLRPWLDQLLSPQYIDQGPVWLTRILMGGKDPYDRAMLRHAIDALDIIAPETRPVRILAISC